MTLFHAVTCTPQVCDPPRRIEYEVRGRPRSVELPGCPIAYPTDEEHS